MEDEKAIRTRFVTDDIESLSDQILFYIANVLAGLDPKYSVKHQEMVGLRVFTVYSGDTPLGRVKTDGEYIGFRPPVLEWNDLHPEWSAIVEIINDALIKLLTHWAEGGPVLESAARAYAERTRADESKIDRSRLRQILATRFGETELRDICFDLGVEYGALPGEGTGDKARELISYCQRHELILELIERGKQSRPDIVWSDVA